MTSPVRAEYAAPAAVTQTLEATPAAAPATERLPGQDLLDAMIAASVDSSAATSGISRFLQATTAEDALLAWLGSAPVTDKTALRRYILGRLNRDIARIDALLNGQVNTILHNPDFQRLEASWRSLRYLVDQVPDEANVKVRVLNVGWRELTKDLTVLSLEFDQSQLFRKVYEGEFGMPGGEPFGLLVGDFEIRNRLDDVETLSGIASVAAAAFAPFVAAAHPSLMELENFTDLERLIDLGQTFEHVDFLKWKALRKKEDARFVGLTLPRVLARLPYVDDSARADGFRFREEVGTADRKNYLWGNAAYAFAAVAIRAFADSGWFADIRGARRGDLGGGLVTGLPVHGFSTDKRGVVPKSSTEVMVTDAQERELSTLGFIPLCACKDTELAAFYSNQSIQEPRKWDQAAANANARLSTMLQYMLCASRFAHYIKVQGRDRIGSLTTANEIQQHMARWLLDYTSASDKPDPRHPLREAKVEVEEILEKPGTYECRFYLRPHYQLEKLTATLELKSTLSPVRR
jgi:type VI secretion system ImpC/EvpB family protein